MTADDAHKQYVILATAREQKATEKLIKYINKQIKRNIIEGYLRIIGYMYPHANLATVSNYYRELGYKVERNYIGCHDEALIINWSDLNDE